MCVTDSEQLSLKIKKCGVPVSACVSGENLEKRKASRSVARFEYPGIELRTLFAKDMSLDV